MGIRSKATSMVAAVLVATTAGTARADTGREVIQQGLDEVVQAGVLGVQVRVTSGREHFTARSGKAELGSNRPVPLNGKFRAASITKTFTATVVLQLVGEGELALDAPVDRYLPGLIDQRITVRNLLQHTSGLYDHRRAPVRPRRLRADPVPALGTGGARRALHRQAAQLRTRHEAGVLQHQLRRRGAADREGHRQAV